MALDFQEWQFPTESKWEVHASVGNGPSSKVDEADNKSDCLEKAAAYKAANKTHNVGWFHKQDQTEYGVVVSV